MSLNQRSVFSVLAHSPVFPTIKRNRILLPFFVCVCSFFLLSCDSSSGALSTIKASGKLVVLTTNMSTTYYFDREDNLAGPEYEMTQSFAVSLGLNAEYKVYETTQDVINALRNGEGDIAAAGLTMTSARLDDFVFGPAYQEVSEYLVCHRDGKTIKKDEQLKEVQIVIPVATSYIDTLKKYPAAEWTVDESLKTIQLLEKVSKSEIECTVSDSTIFDIERRYHPEIISRYTLKDDTELAWMINKNNSALADAVSEWFETYENSGELSAMIERYYGFIELFDYVDTHKLLRRVEGRLPKYKSMFIGAATEYGLSPSMLAAQSYQESHWDPKAKSPTGVRGMMMLTQPVAKSLGVESRLDAKQNIIAGAKFMKKMRKIFDDVAEPDKTWLALAAYNVGRGHINDAQTLARKLDKDPDKWVDMKEVLPLLSEKKYYKDLKYGYARGNEPVQYVNRIRNYDDLIREYFK